MSNDLKRSDSYYRKLCLEQQGLLPKQSEIKKRLGDALTKVFFESCLSALKPYLGLSPTLEGPKDDLWVSPSDLLIGKVRLKPPLTTKHIQALTHQGILDIGREVEEKFINEHELDKKHVLSEQEEMLLYMAEKEKKEAVAKVRGEEKKIQAEIVEKLKKDFEETLADELKKLQQVLEVEKLEAVEEGKKETEQLMQIKLELAVLETVQRLTEQFAEELIKQSKCLHQHFWYHVKQEKLKLDKAVLLERSECQQNLAKLRREMESENIANVMYVLAKERRRCSCEKQALKANFITRLQELEKELEERGEKLQKTVSELERVGLEVRAREEAMFEIIKQFQKFIYFVLRAVPTQAEYLLNVEKLMIFELTKTVMNTKPGFFHSEAPTMESSETFYESEEGENSGFVAKDFHECENYMRYSPSVHTLTSEEDLPAFTYDENLYVREDFRNMISQGLKISKSNEFWNFDVEDLVQVIQPDLVETHTNMEDPGTPFIAQEGEKSASSNREHKSFVSVRFSKRFDQITLEEKVLQSHSYDIVTTASIENEVITDMDQVIKTSNNEGLSTVSRLEFVKDSVALMKEKVGDKKKTPIVNTNSQKKLPQDSFLINAKKSVESKISATKEILARRKDSKIELARDSIELLKSKDAIRRYSEVMRPYPTKSDIVHKKHHANIGVQVESVQKTVQISHIDFIPNDNEKKKSSLVFFSAKPKIIPIQEEPETDKATQLPMERKTPEEIYGKPSEVKVVGDKSSTAHLESQDEFTAKRVMSFIRIFREDASLRKMFTEVHNK